MATHRIPASGLKDVRLAVDGNQVVVTLPDPVVVTPPPDPVPVPDPVPLPPTGAAKSIRVAAASCSNKGYDSGVWRKWDSLSPAVDYLIHMGDLHYRNASSPAIWAEVFQGIQGTFLRKMIAAKRALITRSDHDFRNDCDKDTISTNGDATNPKPVNMAQATAEFRAAFPDQPYWLPAPTDPPGFSRILDPLPILVIMPDQRTEKDNYSVQWGVRQKAIIMGELERAKKAGLFVIFVSDVPTSGDEFSKADRRELWNHAKALGLGGQIEIWQGDQHCCAYDDGSNHRFDTEGTFGIPQLSSAPIRSSQSVKGGPYSGGTFWASNGSNAYESATWTDITWDGKDTLTLKTTAFAGKDGRVLKEWTRTMKRTAADVVVEPPPVVVDPPPVVTPPTGSVVTAYDPDAWVANIGIVVHPQFQNDFWGQSNAWKQPLIDLGIRRLRCNVGTVPEALADLMDVVEPLDAKVLFTVGNDPGRQIPFIRDRVPAGRILGLEGPNEPNSTEGWLAPTLAAMAEIKRVADASPLTDALPILAPSVHLREPDAFRALGDLSQFADVANVHHYTGGRMPSLGMAGTGNPTTAQAVFDMARANVPGQSLWITEYGQNVAASGTTATSQQLPEDLAAKYIIRELFLYPTMGVERIFLYALADSETTGNRFGLLETIGTGAGATFRPRAAYTALQRVLAHMSDRGPVYTPKGLAYTLAGDLTNVRHVLFQRKSGAWTLAIWLEVPLWANVAPSRVTPRPLTLKLPGSRIVSLLDPHAGTTAQLGAGTEFALSVPGHVQLIDIV